MIDHNAFLDMFILQKLLTLDLLEAKLSCFPMLCHCHAGCMLWADFMHFCHWVGRAVKCQFWKMRLSTEACVTELSRGTKRKLSLGHSFVLDSLCLRFHMHFPPSSNCPGPREIDLCISIRASLPSGFWLSSVYGDHQQRLGDESEWTRGN